MMTIESEKKRWFARRLLTWAEDNLRDYPWRRTSDPYFILVAEFLLQRTDADTVVPIYEAFLIQYPTLEKLAIAPIKDIAELLQPLGFCGFEAQTLTHYNIFAVDNSSREQMKKDTYNFILQALIS